MSILTLVVPYLLASFAIGFLPLILAVLLAATLISIVGRIIVAIYRYYESRPATVET